VDKQILMAEREARPPRELELAILFSDIRGFTTFSETQLPYDVVHILNRYFHAMGGAIREHGGYIDKYMGDGIMALFGLDGNDPDEACRSAIRAAQEMTHRLARENEHLAAQFDTRFRIGVGIHVGEVVVGEMGHPERMQFTAIGDAVNVASRVEAANKEAGTRMLISDALLAEVEGKVVVADFIRTRLAGTEERITLHEITGLTPEGAAALELPESRDTMFMAGRSWTRMFPASELAEGEHRVMPFPERDIVFARKSGNIFAFNNACPHLNIPLFEPRPEVTDSELGHIVIAGKPLTRCSDLTEDRGLVCRWHRSCFDLQSGEIRDWVPTLEDGVSPGWEFLGRISKNPARLQVFPCRVHEGDIWIAVD
jgi:class 3 adenylate cyclase/nitrite reductase/ring-hydroxylating ferredoxin subunit